MLKMGPIRFPSPSSPKRVFFHSHNEMKGKDRKDLEAAYLDWHFDNWLSSFYRYEVATRTDHLGPIEKNNDHSSSIIHQCPIIRQLQDNWQVPLNWSSIQHGKNRSTYSRLVSRRAIIKERERRGSCGKEGKRGGKGDDVNIPWMEGKNNRCMQIQGGEED